MIRVFEKMNVISVGAKILTLVVNPKNVVLIVTAVFLSGCSVLKDLSLSDFSLSGKPFKTARYSELTSPITDLEVYVNANTPTSVSINTGAGLYTPRRSDRALINAKMSRLVRLHKMDFFNVMKSKIENGYMVSVNQKFQKKVVKSYSYLDIFVHKAVGGCRRGMGCSTYFMYRGSLFSGGKKIWSFNNMYTAGSGQDGWDGDAELDKFIGQIVSAMGDELYFERRE